MNCANCNAPLPADAAFCPSCGHKPGAPDSTKSSSKPALGTFSGLGTVAPMRESKASVLEPGTKFADRYEVVRKLGEGGMGIVYVAKDTNTGEEMVLKLIHPDLVAGEAAVKKLMSEGMTARQIRHSNIVAVYDVSQHNGQAYFTMEYVRGGTLRSWLVNGISSGKEVSLQTAAGIMKSMLAGLSEAHRMGVIHRDLKPENVLLAGDPNAGNFDLKILDFGIAKAIGANVTRSGGGPIGTPIYMAPEQMTSADAVGPPADIYSLSVMLYELLMDAPPQGRIEPVSKNRRDVPQAIDTLLEKGLSSRPKSRPASAAEFGKELDRALGSQPQSIIIPDPIRPDPDPLRDVKPAKEPWYKHEGALKGSSNKTKMILGGIGALLVIGAIGNMMGGGGNGGGGGGGGSVVDTPTTTTTTVFNAAGYWIDMAGNRFTVTHDNTNFTASATIPGYGRVTLTGTLTIAGSTFTVRTQAGAVLQGRGEVYPDGNNLPHMRYTLSDGTQGDFKINHTN